MKYHLPAKRPSDSRAVDRPEQQADWRQYTTPNSPAAVDSTPEQKRVLVPRGGGAVYAWATL